MPSPSTETKNVADDSGEFPGIPIEQLQAEVRQQH